MPDEIKSNPELNPEDYFSEGFQTGEELAREELAEQLEDAGFDPDEIDDVVFGDEEDFENEGAYDPAPRRGRKGRRRARSRSGRSRGRKHGGQRIRHPALVYDPAPRRRYGRRRGRSLYDPAPRRWSPGKRTKGLTGLKKLVLPATAGLSFYAMYAKRAKDLGKASPFEAIMYDLQNLDANAAIDRLQARAGSIAVPAIAGVVIKTGKGYVKGVKGIGTLADIAGDALIGLALSNGVKALLDPPVENGGNSGIRVISSSETETTTGNEQVALAVHRNPFGV